MSSSSDAPRLAAARALDWVADGMVVGLGTGHAALAFVEVLAQRVKERGWKLRCVATSGATAHAAARLDLTLHALAEVEAIDVTVDGADEIDPHLNAIKGLGGALLREKVLARCSRKWVLCVGADKRVKRLGARGNVPVEVVPFALPYCERAIAAISVACRRRTGADDVPYLTDNGNAILDCHTGPLDDARALEASLKSITGVIDTGLFLGMSPIVLTQHGENVDVEGVG